jgi:hypothetical protein
LNEKLQIEPGGALVHSHSINMEPGGLSSPGNSASASASQHSSASSSSTMKIVIDNQTLQNTASASASSSSSSIMPGVEEADLQFANDSQDLSNEVLIRLPTHTVPLAPVIEKSPFENFMNILCSMGFPYEEAEVCASFCV